MATSTALRDIFAAGRPLIEQWIDVAEQIAALRDVATDKGLDWSQLKALMKAQIQDERDDNDGKRVKRIVEKAEFASAYADMLGLVNMNENNFSAEKFDAETGEITDEPEAAAEVAGDYLREPVAAEQGQIVREGDAPRETGRQDDGDDRRTGGVASSPDTEQPETATQSDGDAIVAVKGSARFLANAAGVEPPLSDPHPNPLPTSPAADQPGAGDPLPLASGTLSDEAVPAFLKPKKTAADYRPNCQNPGNCASSGLHHCYQCKKAMAESEAA